MYHITTLSPALIGLPPSSVSRDAVRRMWITGVCQRMISDTALSTSAGIGLQLAVFVGELIQRQQAAAHGIAGGVVAADDQQRQVAHEFLQRHVARGGAVRQHRQQVEFRRLRRAVR